MTCARGGPCRRLQPVFSLSQTFIRDWYGTSRRFASTLIRSSRSTGKRREIDLVVGFKIGESNRLGLGPVDVRSRVVRPKICAPLLLCETEGLSSEAWPYAI